MPASLRASRPPGIYRAHHYHHHHHHAGDKSRPPAPGELHRGAAWPCDRLGVALRLRWREACQRRAGGITAESVAAWPTGTRL